MKPTTIEELQTIIREHKALMPRGGGTKPALSGGVADGDADSETVLDMRGFSGIIEYQPGEYTFTAYAGTPVKTIVEALAEHGQYLPFDPLLIEKGATLGGTVAANTSGSGRWRYGGVRDFILGVRFVDGQGRSVRSGGKVVKNAAGFDLPKFFVGSSGRYGALVEMSFKVFPKPAHFVTVQSRYGSVGEALETIFRLMRSPLETDAIDIETDEQSATVLIRLGGLEAALAGRVERLQSVIGGDVEIIDDDAQLWQSINNLEWSAGYAAVIKVPITPRQVADFERVVRSKRRYSAAGNVAWVAVDDVAALSVILNEMQLTGLQLTGKAESPFVGRELKGRVMLQRMKTVLDPDHAFGGGVV